MAFSFMLKSYKQLIIKLRKEQFVLATSPVLLTQTF